MKKKIHIRAVTVFILTAVVCLLARPADPRSRGPKIKIMTTVLPLMEFARAVAGESADIRLLLPPGAEVHTWQPRVSDIEKVAASDMFIYIGQNLEPWVKDILKSIAGADLIIMEAGRELRMLPSVSNGQRHGLDPHVWLDFDLDQILLDRICVRLKEIEPVSAAIFEGRASAYKEKLRRLDEKYRETFKSCLLKTFIFSGHAAFGYLAGRYGLEQISVYGPSPDAAPTPKELAGIIDRAKRKNIKTIFSEQNVGDKLAKLIAAEIGADIRVLNPGHNLTKEQIAAGMTFLDLMEMNLESFKHGLACR